MATDDTMTINMAPHSAVYSPHVRDLKTFVEQLTERLNESLTGSYEGEHDDCDIDKGHDHPANTDYRTTVVWLDGQIKAVRKAMGDVLTDDFLLIVDGKRLPGGRRNDIR